MNKDDLVIVGASGHAKVVFDIADTLATYNILAFIDEFVEDGGEFFGIPVRNSLDGIQPCSFVIAIGDNQARKRLFNDLVSKLFQPVSLIHPSAVVSTHSSVAPGTVICPKAVVNANATVGENCIVNTGAIIEHDCVIGAHSHISVGVCLAGNVHVGEGTLIGVSAAARPRAQIGQWSIVGAGAVVTRDIPDHCTAIGIPAKPLPAEALNS